MPRPPRRPPRRDRRRYFQTPEERPAKAAMPARVKMPPLPSQPLEPKPGRALWTCRAGFEAHLYEELAWAKLKPRALGPALVESDDRHGTTPTFARMGFGVAGLARDAAEAQRLLPKGPTRVQAWVPDSDVGNRHAAVAAAWETAIEALRPQGADPSTPWKAHEAGAFLGQVCVLGPQLAAVGAVRAREALSLAAGGRQRMRRSGEAPSRAAMKLDEALEWLGVAPAKGELCVDLGSAPGGWTRRLLERGARVWSVDPAKLDPDVAAHPRVRHFQESAFSFEPAEAADWLFCDMAWRPLEVAQLLGKWARRKWTSHLVANLKLPMKDKLPVLFRAQATLEEAGWKRLRFRQLYHDRDEVTLIAGLW